MCECREYCIKVTNINNKEYCKHVTLAALSTVMTYNPVNIFIRAVIMSLFFLEALSLDGKGTTSSSWFSSTSSTVKNSMCLLLYGNDTHL